MLGTKQATKKIQVLTVADLPMTFGRKFQQALTGKAYSKAEYWEGHSAAVNHLSEARYWAGTSREAPGDNQLLALPFEEVVIHFIVQAILKG